MCFSASASFVTAGVTGAIGVLALSRAESWRDVPLAATPLLFGAQQAIEGLLWTRLPLPPGHLTSSLTMAYLLFALPFWPAFVPIAALLVEPEARRRRMIAPMVLVGLGVGVYLLLAVIYQPHHAALMNGHIVYDHDVPRTFAVPAAYLAAVCAPLLISSQRPILLLGGIVLIGAVVAYVAYYEAFQSVWCYFAAAASVVIAGHFMALRRSSVVAVA